MSDLDVLGSFWPAGQPDNRLPGRLALHVKKGPVLELCGSFHDPGRVVEQARAADGSVSVGLSEMFESGSPPIRILGDTTQGPVSLDHCLVGRSSWSLGSSGSSTAEYHALQVFQGAHFDDHTPLEFDEITFRLGHLAEWIAKSGLRIDPNPDPKAVDHIRITVPPPARYAAWTELGELVLACRYIPRGNGIVGIGIDRDCSVEFRYPEGRPLAQILEVAAAVQDLVTMGVAAPSRVSGIWLSHSSTQRPIRLWAKWRGEDVDAGESRAIHPAKMLFTYDVIGGLEGVALWLSVWKKFSLCAGTLTNRWYTPQTGYSDFFSTVAAAETFERIRRDEPTINLKKGLCALVSAVGKPFRDLVADVNRWASRIAKTRDNYVVHPGLRGNPDGEDLYWKTELVYTLVVLRLLRECGLQEAALPNLDNCEPMRRLASRLADEADRSGGG